MVAVRNQTRTGRLWQGARLCLDAFPTAEPAWKQPKTSVRPLQRAKKGDESALVRRGELQSELVALHGPGLRIDGCQILAQAARVKPLFQSRHAPPCSNALQYQTPRREGTL